jgi:hypothetical protein
LANIVICRAKIRSIEFCPLIFEFPGTGTGTSIQFLIQRGSMTVLACLSCGFFPGKVTGIGP